jgi:FSR family fosmidomycin resistance protein-like MFS transporter
LVAVLTSVDTARQGSLLGLPPRLWLMTFGHAVIDSNPALVFALVPVIVSHLQIDYARAGALVTLLLLTSSITQPGFGVIQDRRPGLPLASAGLLVAGGAMAATGFVSSYLATALLVFIAGLGVAAFHPQAVAQAASASVGRHSWGIAVFFTGGSTGTAIMTLVIVPLAAAYGPRATLVAIVPAVIAAVLFARTRPPAPLPDRDHINGRAMLAPVRAVAFPLSMLLTVSILRSAVLTAYLAFLPALATYRSGSLAIGGAALAAFLIAGSVGALLGGAASHVFGSSRVVVVSLITGFLGLLPVPWLPTAVMIPWMFVAGTLMFASEAQVTALAQRLLPALVGVASSLMMGVGLGLGNVGAYIAGVIADRQGIPYALTVLTFLLAGAAAAAIVFAVSTRKVESASR